MNEKPINYYLQKTERAAVDVLAVFAPWLGPIPSAYLVGRAALDRLEWAAPIAWIAAVAVESIGVVSVILALRLYEWNNTKRKSDPPAPFWLALACSIFYFVVTIGLTVLMDIFPQLANYAPAIFPLLAAIGAVNIAIKNGQAKRETDRRLEKQERQNRTNETAVTEPTRNETSETKARNNGRAKPDETTPNGAASLGVNLDEIGRNLAATRNNGGAKRAEIEAAIQAQGGDPLALNFAEIARQVGSNGQYVGRIARQLAAQNKE